MAQLFETDVLVIGGGPAGLAAGIAARRHGLRAMVADIATPPIDKACGEGLMPDSLEVLADLGVCLKSCETGVFQGISFVGREGSVAAKFPQGRGLGVRRVLLHEAFRAQAERSGVDLRWHAKVALLDDGTVEMDGAPVRCQWIVGADGQNSQVRRWAKLDGQRGTRQRFGSRQHFRVKPWSSYVEIYWGESGQAYVTPIGHEEVCVALLSRERFPSFDSGMDHVPQLRGHLYNCEPSTSVRGAMTVSRQLESVTRGNVALIGEASGSVDAITGEGLAMAFRQALALAPAMAGGDLNSYQNAHRKIMALPEFMARSMLLLDAHRWLRSRALRAFAREPRLFQQLLSVHVGETPLAKVGVRGLADLGWHLLRA
jgi:flavin-dependent dehydrogenase